MPIFGPTTVFHVVEEMLVLTKPLGIPPSFEELNHGIGLWTDRQQKQSYFYCASTRGTRPATNSVIFRLNINDNVLCDWEFVGKVDFLCENNTISPCGEYFWSMEDCRDYMTQAGQEKMLLRQIDPRTLKYEVFQLPGRLSTNLIHNNI